MEHFACLKFYFLKNNETINQLMQKVKHMRKTKFQNKRFQPKYGNGCWPYGDGGNAIPDTKQAGGGGAPGDPGGGGNGGKPINKRQKFTVHAFGSACLVLFDPIKENCRSIGENRM